MADKEYVGLARLTQVFGLLKTYIDSQSGGGSGSNVDTTESAYNALPAADKTNGSTYYVS